MEESLVNSEIIGRIENATGHTQDIVYDLVFMTDRILALIVRHPADVPYRYGLMDFFVGQTASRREERTAKGQIAEDRRASYSDGSPDEWIAKSERNFEIHAERITALSITKGIFSPRLIVTIRRDGGEKTLRFGLPRSSLKYAEELATSFLTRKQERSR
jgi:hypothetical protein